MMIGLSVVLGIVGLLLLSFGGLVLTRRSQPWAKLDSGLPAVTRTWIAIIVGLVSILLGVAAAVSILVILGVWR